MSWLNRDPSTTDSEALTEYWDDVVRLAPTTPVPPAGVPSDLFSLVRHLHAAEQADQQRPQYEDRLLSDLLATYQESIAMSSAPFTSASASSPPTWHRDRFSRPPGPGADRPYPIRWGVSLLAAALMIFVLGAAVSQFGWVGDTDRSGSRGLAIVAPATPAPDADPTEQTLVKVPVPANLLPADSPVAVGMAQVTIPRSTTQQSPDEASENPGVLATYILDGTVMVASDETMQLIAAGGTVGLEEVPPGTEITLSAGDTLVTHKSPSEVWTNEGPAEVHMIAFEIYGGPALTSSFPRGTGPLSWNNIGYDYEVGVPFPGDEPMLLRLRLVTVPSDTTLTLPAHAIVQVARPVGAESFGDSGNGEIRFVGNDGESVSGYVMTLEFADGDPATPEAKSSPAP